MNERDELAEVIRGIDGPASLGGLDIADAIIAAGYRKPRTITTAEELDAVEIGTVVKDETGDIVKLTHGGWFSTDEEGSTYVVLPATVLYEPTA